MMQQQPQQQQQQQQQQQIANQQQMTQQMVLCPVRVVYETQILVPPGEQYQPNQTIFINPQNPPPWANQNAAPAVVPQNQMLYVQQMPGNIVPSVQQSIDQNQMYIQQAFPNMQPVMNQNVVMTQNTPDRQILRQPIQAIQIPNVPPDINTINMNQYAQMINAQNVNMMQAMNQQQLLQQNMQSMQVNMPQMLQQVNSPRPQMQQIIRSPMPQQPQQQQQQQPQQQVRPQQQTQVPRSVQQTVTLPQNIVMNQIQNVVQNIPSPQHNRSPMTQQNIRQTLVQSIRHNMPQQVQMPKHHVLTNTPPQQRSSPNTFAPQQQTNMVRQIIPITMQNNTQQINTINTQKMVNNKVPITNINANINQNQTPQIRPRIAPMQQQQIRSPMQQMRPVIQMQPIATQTTPQMTNQYVRPMNRVVQEQPKTQMYKPNENVNKVPPMPTENRKRKSESPDEMRNKVSVNSSTQVTYEQIRNSPQNVNKNALPKSVSDMGVNTSPVHRPNVKTDMKHVNTASPVSVQHCESAKSMPLLNDMGTPTPEQDKTEKLVRNTVYAQARTRKISNTQTNAEVTNEQKAFQPQQVHKQQNTTTTTQTPTNEVKPIEQVQIKKEIAPEPVKLNAPVKMEIVKMELSRTDVKMETKPDIRTEKKPDIRTEKKQEARSETSKPKLQKMETTKSEPAKEVKRELKVQPTKVAEEKMEIVNHDFKMDVQKTEAVTPKPEIKPEQVKVEKPEKKTTDIVRGELKPAKLDEMMKPLTSGKEMESSHGRKSERESFVLTHVLDGIVIQESNVAFPIRIPLREKILPNPPAVKEEVPKRDPLPATEEPKVDTSKAHDSKIMTISKLNLDEESKEASGSQDKDSTSNENDNPFMAVKPQSVKSWSSEELERYLAKTSWSETASILREHEIDGEALFLVSNSQLQEIGINENHANLLCDFVKS